MNNRKGDSFELGGLAWDAVDAEAIAIAGFEDCIRRIFGDDIDSVIAKVNSIMQAKFGRNL